VDRKKRHENFSRDFKRRTLYKHLRVRVFTEKGGGLADMRSSLQERRKGTIERPRVTSTIWKGRIYRTTA